MTPLLPGCVSTKRKLIGHWNQHVPKAPINKPDYECKPAVWKHKLKSNPFCFVGKSKNILFCWLFLCFRRRPGSRAHPPAGGREPHRQGHHHQGPDWREVGPVRRAARGHADVHLAPRGQQPEPPVAGDVRGVKWSPAWDECAQNRFVHVEVIGRRQPVSLLRTEPPSLLLSKHEVWSNEILIGSCASRKLRF